MKIMKGSKMMAVIFITGFLAFSCKSTGDMSAGNISDDSSLSAIASANIALPTTHVDQHGRDIYAIGDLHGDFDITKTILTRLGLVDSSLNWIGGKNILIQLGDETDKGVGSGDKDIFQLFDKLSSQALAAGGGAYALLGNHEFYNLTYNFEKTSNPAAFSTFADIKVPSGKLARYGGNNPPVLPKHKDLKEYISQDPSGRVNAFAPGGPVASILAKRSVAIVIGDSVFVHASLLPADLKYGNGLDSINADTQQWILGYNGNPPANVIDIFKFLSDDMSPVFDHTSSGDNIVDPSYCTAFAQVLSQLGLKRIVKGHDVQKIGINSVCNGMVWRIDVGLSIQLNGAKQYPERWQVLKIPADGSEPQVIK